MINAGITRYARFFSRQLSGGVPADEGINPLEFDYHGGTFFLDEDTGQLYLNARVSGVPVWTEIGGGSSPPNGNAGGDLSGTYPDPTVSNLHITGEAHGDILYRGAAVWGRLPAGTAGQVFTTGGAGVDPTWATISAGSAAPNGPAGGDLAGIYPDPTVANFHLAGEARGDVLYRGATAWSVLAPGAAGTVLTSSGAGADPAYAALPAAPTTLPPSGAAGGDLAGTYPDPTVANLHLASEVRGAVAYRGAAAWLVLAPGTAGTVLTSGGAGADPTYTTLPVALPPSGAAGGDLAGTYPNPTVAKVTLGSDATGDLYYRTAGGILARLGIGTAAQVLTTTAGLPAWATPAVASAPGDLTASSPLQVNGDNLAHSMGGNLTATVLTASAVQAGVVSTGTQTFAGAKTFADDTTLAITKVLKSAAVSGTNQAANPLTLLAGLGTGTGAASYVSLQGTVATTTGAAAHSQVESLRAYGEYTKALTGIVLNFPALKTSTYAVLITDNSVGFDTSNVRTANLPAASAVPAGWRVEIFDGTGQAWAYAITINRAGADTIDGVTSRVINWKYGSVTLRSDGVSKWTTVGAAPGNIATVLPLRIDNSTTAVDMMALRTLTIDDASGTVKGAVNTSQQTFSGQKIFTSNETTSGNYDAIVLKRMYASGVGIVGLSSGLLFNIENSTGVGQDYARVRGELVSDTAGSIYMATRTASVVTDAAVLTATGDFYGVRTTNTQDLGAAANLWKNVFSGSGFVGPSAGPTTAQQHTLPAVASDTVALIAATQTLTNKTLSTGTKVLLGSDGTGDVYYNGGSGTLTRLGAGANGSVLTLTAGVPAWGASASVADASYTVAGILNLSAQTLGAGLKTAMDGLAVSTPTAASAGVPIVATSALTWRGHRWDGGASVNDDATAVYEPVSATTGNLTFSVAGTRVLQASLSANGLASAAVVGSGVGNAVSLGSYEGFGTYFDFYASMAYLLAPSAASVGTGNGTLVFKIWPTANMRVGPTNADSGYAFTVDGTTHHGSDVTLAATVVLRAAAIAGTNQPANNLGLYAGVGTGTGAAGYVSLQGTVATTSGAGSHALAESVRAYGQYAQLRSGVALTPPALKTGTYAVLITDNSVGWDLAGGVGTATLPAASAVPAGWRIELYDGSGSAATNNLTVNRAGSDTLEAGTAKVINTAYGSVVLRSDGVSKWTSVASANLSASGAFVATNGTTPMTADWGYGAYGIKLSSRTGTPTTPSAGDGVLFFRTTSGVEELCLLWPSGTVMVLASKT